MYAEYLDPIGDGGGGESWGEPVDSGITGGTDPAIQPGWTPGGNGWWQFIGGVWRWMTEPAPRTVSGTG